MGEFFDYLIKKCQPAINFDPHNSGPALRHYHLLLFFFVEHHCNQYSKIVTALSVGNLVIITVGPRNFIRTDIPGLFLR